MINLLKLINVISNNNYKYEFIIYKGLLKLVCRFFISNENLLNLIINS